MRSFFSCQALSVVWRVQENPARSSITMQRMRKSRARFVEKADLLAVWHLFLAQVKHKLSPCEDYEITVVGRAFCHSD
ncbi:MAG: hypothetical protein OXC07_13075 [Kistimonas sp.]|nr:hypothetical protein [Kistimonas sp.]